VNCSVLHPRRQNYSLPQQRVASQEAELFIAAAACCIPEGRTIHCRSSVLHPRRQNYSLPHFTPCSSGKHFPGFMRGALSHHGVRIPNREALCVRHAVKKGEEKLNFLSVSDLNDVTRSP
jgi:hypothetical protein